MDVTATDPVDATAQRDTALDPWFPPTFRWVLALPGSPFGLAFVAALCALGLDLVVFTASGLWRGIYVNGVPFWLDRYAVLNLFYHLGAGFSVLALLKLVRGMESDVQQLGPSLGYEPTQLPLLRREVLGVSARSLRIGTAIGCAIAAVDLAIAYATVGAESFSVLAQIWIWLREVFYGTLLCRVIAWGVFAAHRLSRIAGDRLQIDLLDLAALRPFPRNGARLAFFWLLLWSIFVPFLFVVPSPSLDNGAFVAFAALTALQVSLALAAITIPTLGPNRRLRDAKHHELAAVRTAIARERSVVFDPDHRDANAAASRLIGLLAWETRVASIPERLISTDSLRRVGLYLLLPVGSWVASALIQRVVDAFLE